MDAEGTECTRGEISKLMPAYLLVCILIRCRRRRMGSMSVPHIAVQSMNVWAGVFGIEKSVLFQRQVRKILAIEIFRHLLSSQTVWRHSPLHHAERGR